MIAEPALVELRRALEDLAENANGRDPSLF
jgi:hypothetical protein